VPAPPEPSAAIALIDGDHHPDAVRDALAALAGERDVRGAVFCGGEEKLAPEILADPERFYGVPVMVGDRAAGLRELAGRGGVSDVVDLADEPVLGAAAKLELACVAVDLGLRYVGADFEVRPPALAKVDLPCAALAVIGTGKRTGKTAVCGHWAALLRERDHDPLIVAMGRGGPAEPVLAGPQTSLADLLAIARAGRHAASDYLEGAALAGVATVGCRRVGGGLAGASVVSNVVAGARLAAAQRPGVILFEGSGAALPPVEVDATVCVVGSRDGALAEMGPYRLLRSQVALVAPDDADLARDVARWCPGGALRFTLVPEPVEPVAPGARVAFFSTGAGELEGLEPVLVSRNLARRGALSEDLARAAGEGCDVYLTELKAAAVDTVAEAAEAAGARLVFVRNRPVSRAGERDLDEALLTVHGDVAAERAASS
jgi:cyclic 2,3-diphosphoglycerate synthetase